MKFFKKRGKQHHQNSPIRKDNIDSKMAIENITSAAKKETIHDAWGVFSLRSNIPFVFAGEMIIQEFFNK